MRQSFEFDASAIERLSCIILRVTKSLSIRIEVVQVADQFADVGTPFVIVHALH